MGFKNLAIAWKSETLSMMTFFKKMLVCGYGLLKENVYE